MSANPPHNGYKNFATWSVSKALQNEDAVWGLAKCVETYTELLPLLKECNITSTPDDVLYTDPGLDIEELDIIVYSICKPFH